VRDLEAFLDELAVVQPVADGTVARVPSPAKGAPRGEGTPPTFGNGRNNLLTFAPEGTRGVAAYIDGQKTAAT